MMPYTAWAAPEPLTNGRAPNNAMIAIRRAVCRCEWNRLPIVPCGLLKDAVVA